jgi:DNA repair protein RadD
MPKAAGRAMTLDLRPYQSDAINGLMAWFEANLSGNPLVVLPCGAGKSIINAKIVEIALSYPDQRILCLTHVRELIGQNYAQFKRLCPDIDAGIYCSGLKRKELNHAVTFASIQSIHKKAMETGFINLVVVDEVHLLSDQENSSYRLFLRGLLSINPKMRIVGLTATPFRLKTGLLHKGKNAMFSDIAYELPLQRLVQEGWLVRMYGKQAKIQGDTSQISVKRGEFVIREAETVFDEEKLVQAAIKEMLAVGAERKTWLIFSVSIKHAEHVAVRLNEAGISCKSVSEKTPEKEREQIIKDLKSGALRAVSNVTILTTGTDIPNIDMVVMLRPTKSPGLFLQMAGRGLRLSPETGKENCILLDFAGNLIEHGPVTHVSSPPSGERREEKKKKGKVCPECESVCPSNAKECFDCGYEFLPNPRKIKHGETALDIDAMSNEPARSNNDVYEWYFIKSVSYHKHCKLGSPPSLKVVYNCKYQFCEWICLEHSGFAKGKAVTWWTKRAPQNVNSVDEAISYIMRNGIKTPTHIRVKKDGKYPAIVDYRFDTTQESSPPACNRGNLADIAGYA